jgi:hypothetical protein
MKTICRLGEFAHPHVSIYLFEDDTLVTQLSNRTIVGPLEDPEIVILDVDPSNSVIHENVPSPSGYRGWKYTYTADDGWNLIPNFRDFYPD